MVDDSRFLHVICADPDNDGPRLLYADYLEEKGDAASVARAEFIRVQCAIAVADIASEAFAALRRREMELLGANWRAWLQPMSKAVNEPRMDNYSLRWLPDIVRHGNVIEQSALNGQPYLQSTQFRRGFPAHATLIHKQSRGERNVALLWDRAPLDGLSLLTFESDAIGKTIAAIEGGERLRSLEIGFAGDDAIAHLARERRLRNVRQLILRGVQGTDDVAELVAKMEHLTALETLVLEICNVGQEGLRRLCQAPFAANLETMMILRCDLTNASANILVQNWPASSKLALLDLDDNRLTNAGWNKVQERFPGTAPTGRKLPWPARFYLPEIRSATI